MDIMGKRVLVLGGAGEVGMAVCRKILLHNPGALIVASLLKREADEAVAVLRKENKGTAEIKPEYGNIFLPVDWRWRPEEEQKPGFQAFNLRKLVSEIPEKRKGLIEYFYRKPLHTVIETSLLYKFLEEHSPDVVVDCINTATGVAYQNVYEAVDELLEALWTGDDVEKLREKVEITILSISLPQLVRHVQILHHTLKTFGVNAYIKVGTTGTGGMGLNIPYTHGEESPSRMLMTKSSVAGAHSLLLFLLGRTPGCGAVKEIKPAALIAWKDIRTDKIRRRGSPIPLFDCPVDGAVRLIEGEVFDPTRARVLELSKELEDAFIDTGENGVFALEEFKAITTLYQMEYVTPEEVADAVVDEIRGRATGKDVVAALDSSVMGATYRAGFLRDRAIRKLEDILEHARKAQKEDQDVMGYHSVAFEILGPPRLSKLLFESYILRETLRTMESVIGTTPSLLSQLTLKRIEEDRSLRVSIISVGIPILLEGNRLLLAPGAESVGRWRKIRWEVKSEAIEKWCEEDWVDLRESNMALWQKRFRTLLEEIEGTSYKSSRWDRTEDFWPLEGGEHLIDPGEVVGWLFIRESRGAKLKH